MELVWYGGFHYLLYVALVSPPDTKFNPKHPRAQQHRNDAFWTTVGFLINSAIEVGFIHLWATGRIPLLDPEAEPWWALFWVPVIPMTQDIHFFFNHRMLHFKPLCEYSNSLTACPSHVTMRSSEADQCRQQTAGFTTCTIDRTTPGRSRGWRCTLLSS